MKKLVTIAIAALAGQLLADTITWTGGAGDNLWGTAGNWSANAVPTKNDDVSVGDNVTISANATTALPKTLTFGTNSKLVANNNELQFWGESVITGGSMTGNLLAAQQGSSKITISDCTLINVSTDWTKGWYRSDDTAHVNIVQGSSGAASYTFPTTLIENGSVYRTFVDISNPLIKFDGANIASEADFNEKFMITADAEAGTTTVSLMPLSGWVLSTPAASGVTSSAATLSSTLRHLGEGIGTIVFAYATTAAGIDLSSGEELTGTLAEDATFTKTLTGLTDGTIYYFGFGVKVNGEIVGQSAVSSFCASDCSAVFMGSIDNSWDKGGNWTSGAVPTASDTILIKSDCLRSGNLDLVNWNVAVDGAALTVDGEINQTAARTVRNGKLFATVFVGSGTPIEVRGSDIVSTTTRGDITRGFWATAPFFNFHSGNACSYTYHYNGETPPSTSDEFTALFTQECILVDGVVLTDSSRVEITVDETEHTVKVQLLESAVEASFAGAASAVVNELDATLSVTVEVGGGRALYALVGDDPNNLTATLVAAEASDATTYNFPTNGIEGSFTYYQFRLGDDEGAIYDSVSPQSFFATAVGNVWIGSESASASLAANWSKNAVPTTDDIVYIVADVAQRNTVEWNIANATVASWTQIGNVTVSFQTASNSTLTVTGDVDLQGGTWTHQGSSATPDKAINVSVGGDMTIVAGASVNAGAGGDGAATASRGYSRGNGPGYLREAGGSFAGDGGHIPSANFSSVNTYGSILDPFSYGSGGWGNGNQYAGGGIVKLVIAGTLTVNGTICSRGFGWPLKDEGFLGGAGSGGTVNITAGSIAGSGRIDADGGNNGLYGPGSGGRVKVALTAVDAAFTSFSGSIRAFGGSMQDAAQAALYDVTPGAAGTVCLVEGSSAPVIKVYNEWRYGDAVAAWRVAEDSEAVPSATHLPVKQGGDSKSALKATKWEVSGHGAIRLTDDVRIAALEFANDDGSQKIYLDGHVLSVTTFSIAGVRLRSGTYTAADKPGIIVGEGSLAVGGSGFAIYVR